MVSCKWVQIIQAKRGCRPPTCFASERCFFRTAKANCSKIGLHKLEYNVFPRFIIDTFLYYCMRIFLLSSFLLYPFPSNSHLSSLPARIFVVHRGSSLRPSPFTLLDIQHPSILLFLLKYSFPLSLPLLLPCLPWIVSSPLVNIFLACVSFQCGIMCQICNLWCNLWC